MTIFEYQFLKCNCVCLINVSVHILYVVVSIICNLYIKKKKRIAIFEVVAGDVAGGGPRPCSVDVVINGLAFRFV